MEYITSMQASELIGCTKRHTINRARQFGKTTTLNALAGYLNHEYFVVSMDFLAQLRGYYINRSRFATFKSVILAGVCDIKNLKRKLRPDEEHKDNSPWNIAADFDIDMSFSPVQIREMLESYEADHKTGMDIEDMAQEIYAYTSGYPYLVSRLCQLLDNQIASSSVKGAWSRNNLLEAVRNLVKESNSLVLYQK